VTPRRLLTAVPAALLLAAAVVVPLVGVGVVPAAASPGPTAANAVSTVDFLLRQTPAQTAALQALTRAPRHSRASFSGLLPARTARLAVQAWAAAHDVQIVHSGPFVVQVAGRAATLASLLHTSLTVRSSRGRSYAVGQSALAVPTALSSAVSAVVGLDDRPVFHPASTAYQGPDLQAMNGLAATAAGYDTLAGKGAAVGILNLAGWYPGNLTTYANKAGLPLSSGQVSTIEVSPGASVPDPATDQGGDVEVALDAESVFATAPAADQRLYFGSNTEADFLSILDAMTSDAAAGKLQVASSSWGSCENENTPDELNQVNSAIERLVAAGATFFAATGDAGAYDCSVNDGNPADVDNTPAVDFPASSPFAVAVGGTRVTSNPPYTYTAWGTVTSRPSRGYAGDGSGGGYSQVFAAPSYQAQTGLGTAARTVPDIAQLADPATGFADDDGAQSTADQVGGTSLAAPLAAASLAVIEGRNGVGGLGNILPVLYANQSSFHDVTAGNNGAYSASTGYDLVTGLGSPRWDALAAVLVGQSKGEPTLALPATTRTQQTSVSIRDPNAGPGSAYKVGEADSGCGSGMSSSPPSSVLLTAQQGTHTVVLNVLDPNGSCHTVMASTVLDTVAPSLTASETYTGTTSATYVLHRTGTDLGSGLAHYIVATSDVTAARSSTTVTPDGQTTMTAVPGHTYRVSTVAVDKAGNQSAAKVVSFRAPTDDRSLSFTGSWLRQANAHDYAGTQSVSGTAGALARYAYVGQFLELRFARSPQSGIIEITVDGKLAKRVDLYSAALSFRYAVDVASAKAGRHVVSVNVLGVHRAGATGSRAILDSISWH
jgi:hypothetical protein